MCLSEWDNHSDFLTSSFSSVRCWVQIKGISRLKLSEPLGTVILNKIGSIEPRPIDKSVHVIKDFIHG